MSDRVLVVEDNVALAENVAELLQEEGVSTTQCKDPASALEAAQQGFDLAIVDIGLGGSESGLDLIPHLRRHSAHGEILLMTGNASLNSAIVAIRRAVYAYIPKPFQPDELVLVVKRALAQVALKRDRQTLAQRLSASEALYRGVVATVEACILGLDEGGIVRFANRFSTECLELSQEGLIGREFASLGEAGFRQGLLRIVARATAGEAVRDHECRHEAQGGLRTVRWTLTPLVTGGFDAAQRAAGLTHSLSDPVVLAVGIDMTDLLELEQKRAEAEALAAMGILTTSLAHEIRNPLNAAKLQLELLVRRARRIESVDVAAQVIQPADLVRSELLRLSSLLDEFLSLARPRPLERKACKVAELFEAVMRLSEPVAQAASVALTASVAVPELEVRADADKLKQVLINLVGNAIDALREPPAHEGRVHLHAEPKERGVLISVSDNGPGVAPEVADAAFKPFVTNKPAGTGLGLAIVQKIVAQHGGKAELLARDGGGTVARFGIPD